MSTLANAAAALPSARFRDGFHHHATVDSTNRVARDMGRDGAADGTLVVADEQTAGRGRRNRTWVSPGRAGLYASLVLRPDLPAAEAGAAVQLVAGIAAAEAVGSFLRAGGDQPLPPPELRWPTALSVGERKIAGILVEAETTGRGFDFLVCGIGINVNHEASSFPDELRQTATSLRLLVGHEVPRIDVLGALIEAFDEWDTTWRRHGLAPIRERWLELSPASRGGTVRVQTEAGPIEGIAGGLSDTGHLLVDAAGDTHEISVGEVIKARPA